MEQMRCTICGKTDFSHASDLQGACIKSVQHSDDINGWRCLVTYRDSDNVAPQPTKSVIRRIIPDILDALKPTIIKVTNCVLVINPNAVILDLSSDIDSGFQEVITVRLGDNRDFKTCLIAQYIDGLLYKSCVLKPTCDAGFFKDEVLSTCREIRKNPPTPL